MLCHFMSSSKHSDGSQHLHLHVQAVQEHAMHHNCPKCQPLPAQWCSVNAQRLATWRTAFIAWQCRCIQSVTVSGVPLELRSVSRGNIYLKTGKWDTGRWSNAIAVAELEPAGVQHLLRFALFVTVHSSREIWYSELCDSGQSGKVGSNVYWSGHEFGSWNDADLSDEVSLRLSDEFLTYSISSACFMPYLHFWKSGHNSIVISLSWTRG